MRWACAWRIGWRSRGRARSRLLSRRGPSEEVERRWATFARRARKVVALQGDVADAASLRKALAQLPADCPPLRGVVHAAGVLADGILTEMSLDQLDRAMSPKVRGAWNLHVATRDLPLDFFVLFSSVASVLGSPGQANYAAGNAYLDALAHARRAAGLPATAINWGPWAGSGMAAEAGRDESVKSRGMAMIEPDDGLEVLGELIKTDAPQVAVMNAHWGDMLKLLGSRRPALLAEIAAEVEEAGGDSRASRVDHAFRQQLLAADDDKRNSLVEEYIRQELARIMGVEPAGLETDQPLSTFGLDSLLALELKNNLEWRLDFTLPMAKLMEGPTIASLAAETARLVVAGSGLGGPTSAAERDAGCVEAARCPAVDGQPSSPCAAARVGRRCSLLQRARRENWETISPFMSSGREDSTRIRRHTKRSTKWSSTTWLHYASYSHPGRIIWRAGPRAAHSRSRWRNRWSAPAKKSSFWHLWIRRCHRFVKILMWKTMPGFCAI